MSLNNTHFLDNLLNTLGENQECIINKDVDLDTLKEEEKKSIEVWVQKETEKQKR